MWRNCESGCSGTVGTDVEQLRINWSAGEIQLRTNSRQDEQSNRDECAPHSSTTNGETWINRVFVSPIPFSSPSSTPSRRRVDRFLLSSSVECTSRASVSSMRIDVKRAARRGERERERETILHVSYDPIRLWPIYGVSYVLSRRNCFDFERIDEKTEARGFRDGFIGLDLKSIT